MRSRKRHVIARGRRRAANDPLQELERRRASLGQLFQLFGRAEGESRRRDVARQICIAATAQCALEEEHLYPLATRAGGRPDNRIRAAQLEGLFVRKVAEQICALAETPQVDDRRLVATVEILRDTLEDYDGQKRTDVLPRVRRNGTRRPAAGALESLQSSGE